MSDFEEHETLASPKLEELPKIPDALAEEVTGQHDLKHVETDEKVVLPSAEDVAQEKQHDEFVHGIEHFDTTQLKHT
uniref:Uncharacterized protein n=1 Tax=Plectus sambesii TaxID=2011161 RepID=A0A914UWU1_9BILA